MLYELHLTTDNQVDVDRWIGFCEAHGLKPLHIELEGDEPYPDQIMFAAVTEGDDEHAESWATSLAIACADEGFPIIRRKLEVPLDKAGDYTYPKYHEAHVKSLIHRDHVSELVRFARAHGWVASRNGLFRDYDGPEKWYFTKRAYGVSYLQAGTVFREAFAQLPDFNWHTVRMEMETVIADDNEELDAGWAT